MSESISMPAIHWRANVDLYGERVVFSAHSFQAAKAAAERAAADNKTQLVKVLECDSFIEYDLMNSESGVLVGAVSIEEVKQ